MALVAAPGVGEMRDCQGPSEGRLTGWEGIPLHYVKETARRAVEHVQGSRRTDSGGQPPSPGHGAERQALSRVQGTAVCSGSGSRQAQGQAQGQAQQGRQEAGRARHGVGGQAGLGAGGTKLRPPKAQTQHRPGSASFSTAFQSLKTGPTG